MTTKDKVIEFLERLARKLEAKSFSFNTFTFRMIQLYMPSAIDPNCNRNDDWVGIIWKSKIFLDDTIVDFDFETD